MLQENNEKQEERLCRATLELAGACKRADQAVRKRIGTALQSWFAFLLLSLSLVAGSAGYR